MTTIHMVDANAGWAIGSLGSVIGDHVLFTTDGGSSWKDVTPPEPIPASGQTESATAYFQDAKTAWVIYYIYEGAPIPSQSVVWRTSDGGLSWTASQPLDLSNLELFGPSIMQFMDGKSGWILAHVGAGMSHDYIALFRSEDGGVTWTRLLDPYNDGGIQICTKNAMLFTDATHGWLTGDCGGVMAGVLFFRTTDAGSTWQAVTLPEPPGASGIFATGSNYACGSHDPFFFGNDLGRISVLCTNYNVDPATYSYYMYSTKDGGTTWIASIYPGQDLYFVSADTGWAIASKIQRTTDGGVTWVPISDVSWTAQFDFIDATTGWVVARSDAQIALVKSTDGGAHWSILTPKVGP